jgi:hypothetical protein
MFLPAKAVFSRMLEVFYKGSQIGHNGLVEPLALILQTIMTIREHHPIVGAGGDSLCQTSNIGTLIGAISRFRVVILPRGM